MRRFLIAFPSTLAAIVLIAMLLPQGEVVTLVTVDSEGRDYASALWIVEVDGAPHLRAGNPAAGWLERLTVHPLVEIERGDDHEVYQAIPVDDAGVRRAVNEALADKYGFADRLVRSAVDVERSVPVRLEPTENPGVHARH